METDLDNIRDWFIDQLNALSPELITSRKGENTETNGTKEVMQGKQKVAGHYFASIVSKPKDVRLYFFPIYTHAAHFDDLSAEARKMLKGKSCFHIKKLDDELKQAFSQMFTRGKELYLADHLI